MTDRAGAPLEGSLTNGGIMTTNYKQNIFLERGKVLELMTLAKIGEYSLLLSKVEKIVIRAKKEERIGYINHYSKLESFLNDLVNRGEFIPQFSVYVKGN